MADSFSAEQIITDKGGKATPFFEDFLYQLHHIEEGSPASNSAGQRGELRMDGTYLYGCVATDTWGRIAWTTGY